MSPMTDGVEIIAHRGYSARAPENTLAALEAAFAAGADAVELDLHTAACGTPVLLHDAMLSRTTNGVGPVRRRTFTQLLNLDAGAWFSADFAGEKIPSLEQALAACSGQAVRVYAEVKGFRELEDLDRMVSLTRNAAMLDRVVFIAMNWTILERMRGQEPTLTIGYIVDEAGEAEEAVQRATGDGHALVDYRASLVLDDPSLAQRALEVGVDVAVWTVDDPGEASRLAEMGVRRFTTNRVSDLLAWKAA